MLYLKHFSGFISKDYYWNKQKFKLQKFKFSKAEFKYITLA